MTAPVAEQLPDVAGTFAAALAADAGRIDAGPPVSAPPRRTDDPDAPHGRAEDGTPNAPYGHRADGRPRLKPAGPGRGHGRQGDDRARVIEHPTAAAAGGAGAAPGAAAAAADGPDYTEQLAELGTAVWLGASSLRGGRLLFLPIPDTRPYAAVWRQNLGPMVGAWNAAARQNATVRGYVERLSGEGSWGWIVGVSVTSAALLASMAEMARADPAVKAKACAVNDAQFEKFIETQLDELGLVDAGVVDDQAAAA